MTPLFSFPARVAVPSLLGLALVSTSGGTPNGSARQWLKHAEFAGQSAMTSVRPDSTPHHAQGGVVAVEITTAGGPLVDQLKSQADSAAAHGQVVLVDVGAPWCGPCQAFQKTLTDPVMVKSLKPVRLVHLDFDTWYNELVKHGYLGGYDLPELFLLTRDGGKGDSFDKAQWSDYADSAHTTTTAQAYGPPLRTFVLAALNNKPKLTQ